MVTGTLDLHIMDKQFLAKASFLKKKRKKKEEITLKNTSLLILVHDTDLFLNTHLETLRGLNSHYRLTAREISNQNMNPFFIPDSIKEKHLKITDGFLHVTVT